MRLRTADGEQHQPFRPAVDELTPHIGGDPYESTHGKVVLVTLDHQSEPTLKHEEDLFLMPVRMDPAALAGP
jgi:hypothetical protein